MSDVVAKLSADSSEFETAIARAAASSESGGARIISAITKMESTFVHFSETSVPGFEKLESVFTPIIDGFQAMGEATLDATDNMGEWAANAIVAAYDSLTTIPARIKEIEDSVADFNTSLSTEFEEISASGRALMADIRGWSPAMADMVNPQIEAGLKSIGEGVKYVQEATFGALDTAETFVYVLNSWGSATADSTAKFHEEAAALRDVARATEEAIAKAEAARPAFEGLGAIQREAAAHAAQGEKIAAIATLNTIEAINERILKEQQLQANLILTGEYDAKNAAATFEALARQKAGIEAGRIKPEEAKVDNTANDHELQMMERLRMQLGKMQDDYDLLSGAASKTEIAMREAARAGFDPDQVNRIGAMTLAVEKLREQEEARKKVEALHGSALDEITKMNDAYDVLTGTATNADIAMREATRAGHDDADVKNIGYMTQLLEDEEKKKKKTDQKLGFTQEGSTESYSAIVASMKQVNDPSNKIKSDEKKVDLLQRQLMALQAIARQTGVPLQPVRI